MKLKDLFGYENDIVEGFVKVQSWKNGEPVIYAEGHCMDIDIPDEYMNKEISCICSYGMGGGLSGVCFEIN